MAGLPEDRPGPAADCHVEGTATWRALPPGLRCQAMPAPPAAAPPLPHRVPDNAAAAPRVCAQLEGDFTWLRNIQETPKVLKASDCKQPVSCEAKPVPICPFVKLCGENGATATLKSSEGGTCVYNNC